MQREIIITADGSPSLWIPALGESYHSKFGALQESRHVFIDAGLMAIDRSIDPINILEIGFGTGLNALLTAEALKASGRNCFYETIEPYPLTEEEIEGLLSSIPVQLTVTFRELHCSGWGNPEAISQHFKLRKLKTDLASFKTSHKFHVLYFDAFSPDTQPELWTAEVFQKLHDCLEANGILTTYCSKGAVRRTMEAVGFSVEKLPGPPGKREMLRGRKVQMFNVEGFNV